MTVFLNVLKVIYKLGIPGQDLTDNFSTGPPISSCDTWVTLGATTEYKSSRVLLRGIIATVSQGLVLGLQTNVSVSKTGLFHGLGCWHPSPPWWWLSLPWVMTSYKEKKVRRLVQQHHKRKLCPQSRFGRKRWMCAVLLYDSCKSSPMGHWLGQKQLQRAKPKSRSGRDLTEQVPWRSLSATWCREHLYDKLRLLTSGHSPEERRLFPQLLIAYWNALRGLKDPLSRLHVCSWVCSKEVLSSNLFVQTFSF